MAADYVVSETWGVLDGNYTAAGLGYIHFDSGSYALYTGVGTRQYYTNNADPSYIIVFDIDANAWVITDTGISSYDYFYSNTGTTPPVDVYWYTAYVTEFSLEVSASDSLQFDQGTFIAKEAESSDGVEFGHTAEAFRVVYGEGNDAIEFEQTIKRVHPSGSGLSVSDSAGAIKNKPVTHGLELSDFAIREPMPFNRSVGNNLGFSDYASGYNANDPAHGPCDDEYVCDRDHITLECSDPVITVDLRNPAQDSLNVILNTINRYSRGEELGYKNANAGVHPRFLQLHYSFESMPASQKVAFIAFYKATAGLEIILTDFCGQRWVGCIIDKEIGFDREQGRTNTDPGCPEPDDGLYSWEFTFEGERIPDTYRSWGDLVDSYILGGYGYMHYNVGAGDWEFIEGGTHKYYIGETYSDTALIWMDYSDEDPDYRDFEYGWGLVLIESRSGLPDYYIFDWIDNNDSVPPVLVIWDDSSGIISLNSTAPYYYLKAQTWSGTIIGESNQVIAQGADSTEIECIPASGETFGYWAINGGGSFDDNPLIIEDITQNYQITANPSP